MSHRSGLQRLSLATHGAAWYLDAGGRTMDAASQLNQAVLDGDDSAVSAMLARDPKLVDVRLQSGRTLLHVAAAQATSSMVQLLIAHGANVNARDSASLTPLHYAASYGRTEAIDVLLSHGAEVNTGYNLHGGPPLSIAVIGGHADATRALLAGGADPNAAGERASPPLWSAARRGRADMVEALLVAGADANATGWHNETALHAVASPETPRASQHLQVAELLLNHGADVNAQESMRATPLSLARVSGDASLQQLLESRSGVETPAAELEEVRAIHESATQWMDRGYQRAKYSCLVALLLLVVIPAAFLATRC